jgi:hypothetical protein
MDETDRRVAAFVVFDVQDALFGLLLRITLRRVITTQLTPSKSITAT